MKILVTGGAGFIGSNFIRFMLDSRQGVEIVNFDKLTYAGNLNNLNDVCGNKRYQFIKGDICDSEAVEQAMSGCDAVVNFAAESHVDRSIIDGQPFVKTNVMGTYVLLEVSRKLGIKKFVQIGTDEVYGSREKGSFSEKDRLNPSSAYSATKAAADLLALSFFITHKLPVVVVRSSNNFGPYQYPEKFIPLCITNAFEGKSLPVYGDGMQRRDWLFVEDNCAAIATVLEKGKIGEIYNAGPGNECANIEVARSILKQCNKPASLLSFVEDRKGHDRRYAIDAKKLKKIGWKPTHKFEAALSETIGWYEGNAHWWRPLKK